MDRRIRKSREAIFSAFTQLLSRKDFHRITVGEIINAADVGRATFYSHFETKDFLLKEYCEELFCHIFDNENGQTHRHIFDCGGSESMVLHLFTHLQKNDNNILALMTSQNNDLFWRYFRTQITRLVELSAFEPQKDMPEAFWENHVASTLVETIKWWVACGMQESPGTITGYFFKLIGKST